MKRCFIICYQGDANKTEMTLHTYQKCQNPKQTTPNAGQNVKQQDTQNQMVEKQSGTTSLEVSYKA